MALGILFLVLVILIGGERGVKSFITLIGNILVLIISVYLISFGMPPVLIALFGSILFCLITLLYQNGTNVKSYSSIISVIIVICIMSIIVWGIVHSSQIAGYNELELNEDISRSLSAYVRINMKSLMVTVTMLGLLGAIMDTAIAIATSIFEVQKNNKELSFLQLIKSGKSVGNDILGTTANTLFFAGIGETMMMTILFSKFGYSFERIINSKIFFQEFSVIIIANIGCLIIIPITIFVTSFLLTSKSDVAIKIRKYGDEQNNLNA